MTTDQAKLILSRIQQRLEHLGLSRAKACKMANIGVDIIRDLDRRGTIPKLPSMLKLASVLGVSVEWLYGNTNEIEPAHPMEPPAAIQFSAPLPAATPSRIPIIGTAYGSMQEANGISGHPIGWVEAPPSLRSTPNAYAIYVDGDSMSPQHNPGELRFVDPNRPCRPGDSVIIKTQPNPSEPIHLTIKRLVSRNGDEVVTDQINPKRPATVTFRRNAVVSVDRVLTINEMFGV